MAKYFDVAKQVVVGGGCGFCAGRLFQKVGRIAFMSVTGGLLLLHVANSNGYLQVNWKQMDEDVKKVFPDLDSLVTRTVGLVKENATITSAFTVGMLLGLAK